MAFGNRKKTFAAQRRRTRLLNHRVLLLCSGVALAALFLLGQFGDAGIASWWKLRAKEAKLEQEVSHLETANTHLQKQLDELANNPQALEKLAREQHDMHRSDEEVLTVLDGPRNPQDPTD